MLEFVCYGSEMTVLSIGHRALHWMDGWISTDTDLLASLEAPSLQQGGGTSTGHGLRVMEQCAIGSRMAPGTPNPGTQMWPQR